MRLTVIFLLICGVFIVLQPLTISPAQAHQTSTKVIYYAPYSVIFSLPRISSEPYRGQRYTGFKRTYKVRRILYPRYLNEKRRFKGQRYSGFKRVYKKNCYRCQRYTGFKYAYRGHRYTGFRKYNFGRRYLVGSY